MESVLLVGIVVLLLWFGTRLSRHLTQLTQQLHDLQTELHRLRAGLGNSATPKANPSVQPEAPSVAAKPETVPKSPVKAPEPPTVPVPVSTAPQFLSPEIEPAPLLPPQRVAAFAPPIPAEKISRSSKDWEKFIGENLINKLGIVILVLGIGFFVKFAIDKDWINEVGRVAIGLLAGGALLGVAHRLRCQYSSFSSVLVGGGMAVLYFTIAIAFHEYQLFGQTVAFVLMLAITGFTIFLALAYDRLELAVVALIGGFGSPFMVSTGEGNYVVLFVFVLLLNLGILVLAYYKKWPLLNFIAYGFTVLLYGGWLLTRVVDTPNPPYQGALVFGTLFYLVFFLMNMVYNLKERQTFTAREMVTLLSNSALYYAAGMYILANVAEGAYQGLFTLLLAVFNFGFAYTLYRSQRADRNLVYLLIGLVLTFLSLTAPVQLDGNNITLFWALEAVLLLWLSQRAGLPIIKAASALVLGLMLGSLFLDWFGYYSIQEPPLRFLLNRYFLTGLFSLGAITGVWLLLRREEHTHPESSTWPFYRTAVGVVWVLCLYLVLLLEMVYHLQISDLSDAARALLLSFYHYLFLLGLLWRSLSISSYVLRQIPLVLAVLGLFLYFIVPHPATVDARDGYLLTGLEPLRTFLWHYLPLVSFLLMVGFMLRLIQLQIGFSESFGKLSLWAVSFIVIFLASAELEHLWLLGIQERGSYMAGTLRSIRKIGFPILWGLGSFAFMTMGMNYNLKTLRIISLTLFFLTLAKLFAIDVWDMSEGGKIAAFLCLGVLLLTVSFLYQKLKTLILEGETTTSNSATHE